MQFTRACASARGQMVRNNPVSGNLQTLIRRSVDLLYLACKPKAQTAHLRQSCGCVFLLRHFLKHMIETLEPDALQAQVSNPTGLLPIVACWCTRRMRHPCANSS